MNSRFLGVSVAALILTTFGFAADKPAADKPAADKPAAEKAPAEKPAALPEPILIANLTDPAGNQVYSYSTWQNAYGQVANAGVRIFGSKGAQGNGGIFRDIKPAVDLGKCLFVEVALSVQPGNQVPDYTLVLADADGTQSWVRLHVRQLMPGQPVWLRLQLNDFTLSTRDQGKDGKMDWTKVGQWHLQGDWSTKAPAQMLLIALRGRPSA